MSDLRQCKKCGQIKVRINIGKFDLKNKKYVDEKTKLWNGLVCPECNHERMKQLYHNKKVKVDSQP